MFVIIFLRLIFCFVYFKPLVSTQRFSITMSDSRSNKIKKYMLLIIVYGQIERELACWAFSALWTSNRI